MTKTLLKKFAKDTFPNHFNEIKQDINDGTIDSLVDFTSEYGFDTQIEVIKWFEEWATNRFKYKKSLIDNLLNIINDVYDDWNQYSDCIDEDDYFYIHVLSKDKILEYQVFHKEDLKLKLDRIVKIEFLH
jgi:hypothetical protein